MTTTDPAADRLTPDQQILELRSSVDLPALGWTRVRVSRSAGPLADVRDSIDGIGLLEHPTGARVRVADDGTLTYSAPVVDGTTGAVRTWTGLLSIVDTGDRGDTYDRDLLDDGSAVHLERVEVVRRRSAGAGQSDIVVRRRLLVPERLDDTRTRRVGPMVPVDVEMLVSIDADGRLRVRVHVESAAEDHCLRLGVPVGDGPARCATQFGDEPLTPADPDPVTPSGWVHPAPSTRCHQGWIAGGGLLVSAPGLPEVSLVDGVVEITVLRAVGWMSRPDLRTRPGRASPAIPVPGAQVRSVDAHLTIGADPGGAEERWRRHLDAVRAPVVSVAGGEPVVGPDTPVVEVSGGVVTAVKPADDGDGVVVRIWNPSSTSITAIVRSDLIESVQRCRLDEVVIDTAEPQTVEDQGAHVPLGPGEITTIRARRRRPR